MRTSVRADVPAPGRGLARELWRGKRGAEGRGRRLPLPTFSPKLQTRLELGNGLRPAVGLYWWCHLGPLEPPGPHL